MSDWLKRPSTTGGIIYLVAVATMVCGLVVVVVGAWRTGVAVMGVAFAIAFAGRLVLPDEHAGMLRIRRRLVDLVTMGVCSAGMLILAVVVARGVS